MKRGRVTAGELMAKLAADPQYQAEAARRDAALQARLDELAIVELPLVEALKAVGAPVRTSGWDLVNTAENYDQALPLLAHHLHREYPEIVLEGIARALAVPTAAFLRDELIGLLLKQSNSEGRLRDGLAVAIAATTTPSNVMQTVSLARDRRLGVIRLLLLRPLRKYRRAEVREALRELSTDPDLAKEIRSWRREWSPAGESLQ